jgi:hypothetical protein
MLCFNLFAEGLQAIQLEDGTTAYITTPSAESLFGDSQITSLDSSTLSLDQLAAQVRYQTTNLDR